MTNEACLPQLTGRATSVLRPSPALITVAEVMLGSIAIQPTPIHRFGALRGLRAAWAARRTRPSHRSDYLESAAMAREMYRL